MEPNVPHYTTSATGGDVGVDDRPICYWEDNVDTGKRKLVIRASAVGSCTRALVAAALGYEEQRYKRAEEIMSTAATEGNLHEGSIIDRLEELGYKTLNIREQAFTETQVIPLVVIRGHIDSWAINGPGLEAHDEAVVEAKTMSVARYKDWELHGFDKFEKYAWQLSAYMWHYIKKFDEQGTDIKALYAVKNRNTGELWTGVIPNPPIAWERLRGKATDVLKWVLKGELPPCDPGVDSGEKYFCPFVMLHDEEIAPDEDVMLTNSVGMIVAGMAQAHHDLGLQIKPLKVLEARRKEIASDMKPHLTAKRTIAGEYRVVRVDVKRNELDKGAIAEKLGITVGEMTEEYSRPGGYSYYRVDKMENGND